MRSALLATTLLILAARSAAADDTWRPPDPARATELSAIGTGASLALIGAGVVAADNNPLGGVAVLAGSVGLFVLPSLGHSYGEGVVATRGLGLRAAGAAVMLVGLVVQVAQNPICLDFDGDPCPPTNNGGLVVVGLGGALVLAGAIYDIATAADATREHNAIYGVHMQPMAIQTPSHDTVPGLALGGQF